MNAVAYVRVSTEDQVSGTSLDSQALECAEYAKRQGWALSPEAMFREEGVSATLVDRPQLAAMLDYCSKNKNVEYCIVWKVDRLARKSAYHHIIKSKLAQLGVRLVSVTEPLSDDPVGTLMENMLSSFAQFDNEVRTARTTGGMKARTLQGGWPHQPTVGYRKSRNEQGISYLFPDEVMAPPVTEFLIEFASGHYNVTDAVELAYELGIRDRNGNKRNWQSIMNVLVNPVYAGLITTKFTDGKVVKGLHEPLITEATHYRIVSLVSSRAKGYNTQPVDDWPLRGGFLRHTCGAQLTGSSPRGKTGPSPRYSCPNCKAAPAKRVSKMRNKVHDEFIGLLSSVRMDEPSQKLFREIVLRRWKQEFDSVAARHAQYEHELKQLSQKKSRLIDLYIDGKLSDEEKDVKLGELNGKVAMLQVKLDETATEHLDRDEVLDGALLFLSDPAGFWNAGDAKVKRAVQDTVFPAGLSYDFEIGFGTPKLGQSYLLISKKAGEPAENPSLVGHPIPIWNSFLSELAAMHAIVHGVLILV